MAAVSGCNWFTCWNFENSVSSPETWGRQGAAVRPVERQPLLRHALRCRLPAAGPRGLRLQRPLLVDLHLLVDRAKAEPGRLLVRRPAVDRERAAAVGPAAAAGVDDVGLLAGSRGVAAAA